MKLLAGILILTILVVFFIYCSKTKKIKKKQLEEKFIDTSFTTFHKVLPRTDSEIQELQNELDNANEELDTLKIRLSVKNSQIAQKLLDLISLRTAQSELTGVVSQLQLNMNTLTDKIENFINEAFTKDRFDLTNIFDLAYVESVKDMINTSINNTKDSISNSLVHYDEEDISTVTKIGNIQSGLINDLNDIKLIYNDIHGLLIKNVSFMEICSGNTIDDSYPEYVKDYINNYITTKGINNICNDNSINLNSTSSSFDSIVDNNFELGRSICESKKGTCIYEENTTTPKSYYTGTFDYKFYRHKWPQENSCEAMSNGCFSMGELSDRACEGDIKTLWFTKSNAPAEYYSSNVGYISHELLPDNPGNWECLVDFRSGWIDNESIIRSDATNNCENNGVYGLESYDCYTVTNDLINPTMSKDISKSKTWTDTPNTDFSIGECVINNTCRTKQDAQNHVNCLKQNFSDDGTNFECYTYNAVDNTSSSTGTYRKTYNMGTWETDLNRMNTGVCETDVTKNDGYEICRTEYDVNSNISCMADNWNCASFNEKPSPTNIGEVEVNTDNSTYRKIYDRIPYRLLNNTNKGAGNCIDNLSCENPQDLRDEADCHNNGNYRCWTINDDINASQASDVLKVFNKNSKNCEENLSCISKIDALSTAEDACHASQSENHCYRIDDVENSDKSKNIIFKEDDDGYENGRLTKFVTTDTHGTCEIRKDCTSNLTNLCSNQIVSCYNSNNTIENKTMIYNNDDTDKKCIPPEGCSIIPYCSYINVITSSPTEYNQSEINFLDCSAGELYGNKYKWILESSHNDSISKPDNYQTNYDKWSHVTDVNVPNPNCVRDETLNYNTPITISEENEEYTCSPCPFDEFSNPAWTSNIVSGTENKEGTITIPDDTITEVYVLVNNGNNDNITYNSDGRSITYNTKAVISDGACPDRRDASILNTSDYDQKVVYKHTRDIGPDSSSSGCFGQIKHEIKYTLEEHGGRCVFDCMQYFDEADMEETCYSSVEFVDHNSGGDINYTEATCGQSGKRFPSRKIREGRNGGIGCTGNPTNGETLQEFYNEKMGKGVDCSMPKCECTDSYYSAWTSDSITPDDWDQQKASVPCDNTYTHTRTLSNDCDNSTTNFDETQTITHSGDPCCTENNYNSWASPLGDPTPNDWNRQSSSVPCESTYTHTRTLISNNCDNSTTNLPRTETITHTNSTLCPVNCVLNDDFDNNWSKCSQECGGGTQTRTKGIRIHPQNGGTACPGPNHPDRIDTRICNDHPCPQDCEVFDNWENDGGCSVECGSGTQIQRRRIKQQRVGNGRECTESEQLRTITCEGSQVARTGTWSEWTSCPTECRKTDAFNQQTRTRSRKQQCVNGRLQDVPNETETKDCSSQPKCPPRPIIKKKSGGNHITNNDNKNENLDYNLAQIRIAIDQTVPNDEFSHEGKEFDKYQIEINGVIYDVDNNKFHDGSHHYNKYRGSSPDTILHFDPHTNNYQSYIFLNNMQFRTKYRFRVRRFFEDNLVSDWSNTLDIHVPKTEEIDEAKSKPCGKVENYIARFGYCSSDEFTCLNVGVKGDFRCIHQTPQ